VGIVSKKQVESTQSRRVLAEGLGVTIEDFLCRAHVHAKGQEEANVSVSTPVALCCAMRASAATNSEFALQQATKTCSVSTVLAAVPRSASQHMSGIVK
jgi:hypothetical protein